MMRLQMILAYQRKLHGEIRIVLRDDVEDSAVLHEVYRRCRAQLAERSKSHGCVWATCANHRRKARLNRGTLEQPQTIRCGGGRPLRGQPLGLPGQVGGARMSSQIPSSGSARMTRTKTSLMVCSSILPLTSYAPAASTRG